LSARDSDFDIVAGLRLGADDYVTKDTSLPHVAARISALFRRSDLLKAPPLTEDVIERGPLTLDVKRFTTSWKTARVDLTLTEFWMVHALARFPGHVKDRDALMRDATVGVTRYRADRAGIVANDRADLGDRPQRRRAGARGRTQAAEQRG